MYETLYWITPFLWLRTEEGNVEEIRSQPESFTLTNLITICYVDSMHHSLLFERKYLVTHKLDQKFVSNNGDSGQNGHKCDMIKKNESDVGDVGKDIEILRYWQKQCSNSFVSYCF